MRSGTSPRKSPFLNSCSANSVCFPCTSRTIRRQPSNTTKPGRRALSKQPFARLQPHIGDRLRQANAFGLVKTGKNLGLPQLVRSEHAFDPIRQNSTAYSVRVSGEESVSAASYWRVGKNCRDDPLRTRPGRVTAIAENRRSRGGDQFLQREQVTRDPLSVGCELLI